VISFVSPCVLPIGPILSSSRAMSVGEIARQQRHYPEAHPVTTGLFVLGFTVGSCCSGSSTPPPQAIFRNQGDLHPP